MKKVIGLAVAMAAASQANAAITLPGTDVENTGGSELVLVVYDDASKTTYVRDLGVGYRGFNAANSYSFAADSRLTGAFGSTLSSSLVWAVWAADSVGSGNPNAGTVDTWGQGILSTSVGQANTLGVMDGGEINNSANVLTDFINATNTLSGNSAHSSTANGSSVTVVGQGASYSNYNYQINGDWSRQFPGSSASAVGASAYFVMAHNTYEEVAIDLDEDGVADIADYLDDQALPGVFSQFAGLWTLSNNGTLSWAPSTTEVPVPAAAWLFASGLAGLAGVARRRKAA